MNLIKLPSGRRINIDRICQFIPTYESNVLRVVQIDFGNSEEWDTTLRGKDAEEFMFYIEHVIEAR